MLESLVEWAVENRLVVILLTIALVVVGGYSFVNINVEAYPDPAPAIIEVVAQYPGSSAEEVERQITTPLEVALAGMPGLKTTRSKSLFGLSHLRNQFDYNTSYKDARIEVLNRLSLAELPKGVQPDISPTSPVGEIYRFILRNPLDEHGEPVYTLADLKTLQDWTIRREFKRVEGIADVVSFGGMVKRYEIQPDPDRLRRFDITLDQLEKAITDSNLNAGGDYLLMPHQVQVVRGLGLLGDGNDPVSKILQLKDPVAARNILRAEEDRRLHEIRQIVLATTNNVPIRVDDIVDGGRAEPERQAIPQGVIVGNLTRFGQISVGIPKKFETENDSSDEKPKNAREWENRPDVVQGVVLLRKGEQSLPALAQVKNKVAQLNESGKLLPGVKIEAFDDRTVLINRTTDTVHENLIVGMVLVTLVLFVFLNHLRTALIVAINIPLALFFAFALLYLRGKSANLLSLGAVDFGIIVDSSVIMVECIFRTLGSGEDSHLKVQHRILKAAAEVQRSLLFSTLIMVCALLPLFLMAGPEGQIFGPMADAYAFALGGALILALTLSPVLCRMLLAGVKESKDNFLVAGIKRFYLWQLDVALRFRWWVVGGFALLLLATAASLPFMGREFMPELEEGNVYIRGTFPPAVSLQEVVDHTETAKQLLQKYPEVRAVLAQMGRPDDGTDPTSFYNAEMFVPLLHEDHWPKAVDVEGWRGWFTPKRARSKLELVAAMEKELSAAIIGVDWNFSQNIRDNVMETLSGVKGENSVKIFGPDLATLEKTANQTASVLRSVPGIGSVGVFSIMGQTNLEFSIDRDKCAKWNVSIADVQDALATAVGGKAFTQMVEGEKTFDITLRWPGHLRSDEEQILDIPVDSLKNRVVSTTAGGVSSLPLAGTSLSMPSVSGSVETNLPTGVPRRRLRDLVTPINEQGERDPDAPFTRSGASTIAREQGQRLIAVKFSVRGRDLASAVAEAQEKTAAIALPGYRVEWSGEFEEMEAAVKRLASVAALAMILIIVLLYLALRSMLDVVTVFSNVVVICMGGIWSLFLSGTNFNISAGVGFISILGVGIMNGLIVVSAMNAARLEGMDVMEAIRVGVTRFVRPLTMTALAAILGMIPAALATKIGSQTQKPLAIVVVGGMFVTLLFLNLIPVIYSLYGKRRPKPVAGMGH
jgi:cobalt-zinc-cadmium resistance protein CzcA